MKPIIKDLNKSYFERRLAEASPNWCLRRRCLSCDAVIPVEEVVTCGDKFFHEHNGKQHPLVLNTQSPVWEHKCKEYWGMPSEQLWRQFNYWLQNREKEGSETVEELIDSYLEFLKLSLVSGPIENQGFKIKKVLIVVVVLLLITGGITAASLRHEKIAGLLKNVIAMIQSDSTSENADLVKDEPVKTGIETPYDREKRLLQEWVDQGNYPTRKQIEYYKLKVADDQYWEWAE